MKANNIQEYLGSLQQTVVTSWRKHLKSSKHSEHVILNDFYDDMLDAVDELTEAYMAHNGKVEGYVNLFKDTKKMSAYDYVKTIHDFTDENRDIVGDESELQSLVDDVLSVCDTAMYKLKELVGESQMIDLANFIGESLLNEGYEWDVAKDFEIMVTTDLVDLIKHYDPKDIEMFDTEDFDNFSISLTDDDLLGAREMFSWFAKLVKKAYTEDLNINWNPSDCEFQDIADLPDNAHGFVLTGDGDDGTYSIFLFKKPLSSSDKKKFEEFISYFDNSGSVYIHELF